MTTLHRCSTPTDWLCPCGRVARELRRRAIAFDEVRVPRRRAQRTTVRALSGQTRVPLLELDGEALCDSRRIVAHLRRRDAAR
jgi:glutathione S-transferase